ncbi:translation elongation factor Ts [Tyzzerella sp. An114]|uniref:translation elongation factor Ts n=1 Tax=Tyzzerella sp. An114 TaxID=1965545 RepID=UPI000B4408B6|nr:translation elongation factor Ts [Tyzzerella sp. An114]OUQ60089.1 translation elongation factor Ts [Tyzzerella sp. An114]HIT72754.1 elongation factor Ts [Candidatus Fimicola cottocaccae]
MAITASMVKELREMTGVGMLECKKALAETDGDMEKAVELLREKGLAASAKKAGRIASEGLVDIYVSDDKKTAAIVEVNSETDFVAKNQTFKDYVANVAKQAASTSAANMDEFFAEKWSLDEAFTVKEALSQQVAVIGENLNIRRFEKYVRETAGSLVSYVHGGGRIGVLIELACEKEAPELEELGKNVAMQIAALNPKFIAVDNVPADFIEKEKEILTQQAKNDPKNASKPDNIIEKMIVGRLNKEMKEICLVEQPYVKDGDMSVKQYIDSVAKVVGAPITIARYVRFETGEGLAKKEENFAEEVAKAAQ